MATLAERLTMLSIDEIGVLDARIASFNGMIPDLKDIQNEVVRLEVECEQLEAQISALSQTEIDCRTQCGDLTADVENNKAKIAELQAEMTRLKSVEQDLYDLSSTQEDQLAALNLQYTELSAQINAQIDDSLQQCFAARHIAVASRLQISARGHMQLFEQLRPTFQLLLWDNIATYIAIQNYYASIFHGTYIWQRKCRQLHPTQIYSFQIEGFMAVHSYICKLSETKNSDSIESPHYTTTGRIICDIERNDPNAQFIRAQNGSILASYIYCRTVCPICGYIPPLVEIHVGDKQYNHRNLVDFNAWLRNHYKRILQKLVTNTQLLYIIEQTTYDELYLLFALPECDEFLFILLVAFYGTCGKFCDLYRD